MVPLLYSIVDYDTDPETLVRYDRMSALELFEQYGVSRALYDQFLKPLLLVGLFAPPEQLSAADMIATLYFYSMPCTSAVHPTPDPVLLQYALLPRPEFL
jgi:hypothetical protein